jgi:hypothetical protein
MTEQEARDAIIAWAKEHFTWKSQPDVEVAGLYYDAEFNVWDVKIRVSNLSTDPYVTFTENASYPHGIEVSNVEFS